MTEKTFFVHPKPGFTEPLSAAIGRGNLDSIVTNEVRAVTNGFPLTTLGGRARIMIPRRHAR